MTNESNDHIVGFWTVTLCVFAVLSLSNFLNGIVGWFHSQDVRDWWPLGLTLYSAISLAYSAVFSATIQVTRRADIRFVAIYNIALASLLFLNSYLYYTIEIDWFSVNSRIATLTTFQKIIRSDFTPISIYAVFLVGALVAGQINRERSAHSSSGAK